MTFAVASEDAQMTAPKPRQALPSVFLMTDSFSTGGSERQFTALARELDRERFRIQVGCIQKKGEFLGGFGDSAEFPLGGSLYGPASWRMRYRLSRFLRQKRIAIAHAFDFYTNVALLPVARLSGVPVVIGSHRQLGDLLGPAKLNAQIFAFQFCDKVVCNSRAAARVLMDHGVAERKIVVIGNGLPPAAFRAAEPMLPNAPGVLRVGMIARMNTQAKDHNLFLKAAARIATRFPKVEFVLIGDGPLRAKLRREAQELGIIDRAIFLGDQRDIPAVLASLAISVAPSKSESLSNSILESMAAGVPVIASDVGGNRELLGDSQGMQFQSENCEALVRAMDEALSDSVWRQQTAERARRFAFENFSLADVSRRYAEMYQELLEEKSWRPEAAKGRSKSSAAPIRVAIVAASPRYVGGQSVQAGLLQKFWGDDKEVDASFVAIDPLFPRGLRWAEGIPVLRTLLRHPLYITSLWRQLEHTDVAHIFSASYWSFLIAPLPACLLARTRGARVLIHYHSGEALDHLGRSGIARFVLGRADRLVVPGRFLQDVFGAFGLNADAVTNVVDLSKFRFRRRSPLRPHLMCTRGFHPYYCVDVVVRAFAEIQKEYPDARLDLLGTGQTEPEVRKLVRELDLANVQFVGAVSRDQIANYYDRADIFINASRLDNMPVSILEAYASGLPVVTTAPEGMHYVVEDGRTGLVSEVGDPKPLADNVLRLLSDPSLALRLSSNALERCKECEWRTVRQQWLQIYQSMIQS